MGPGQNFVHEVRKQDTSTVAKYWLTARSRNKGIAILQYQQNGHHDHHAG
jgi:hypothetical protein